MAQVIKPRALCSWDGYSTPQPDRLHSNYFISLGNIFQFFKWTFIFLCMFDACVYGICACIYVYMSVRTAMIILQGTCGGLRTFCRSRVSSSTISVLELNSTFRLEGRCLYALSSRACFQHVCFQHVFFSWPLCPSSWLSSFYGFRELGNFRFYMGSD